MSLKERVEEWFTYHRPDENQVNRMMVVRACAKVLAQAILTCCPPGPDQSAAIRKVREAVMTANAGIVCDDSLPQEDKPF